MNAKAVWILVGLCILILAGTVHATGLGSSAPCLARNALEAYCANHGGCPNGGYCYFPDGGYCDLRSFYNGTCPGAGYYEQAIWMAEAYNFLYGDDVSGMSSMLYQYPNYQYSNNQYPYSNPYYYGPFYGYGI
jgi:hypothetical protein